MYNENPENLFLERKTNRNGFIEKIKEPIEKKEVMEILSGNCKNLLKESECLKTELYLKMRLKSLRPNLLIEYIREAWVDKVSDVRITIDKNLKSTTNCREFLKEIKSISKECYILEIKWNKYIPDYLLNIILNASEKRNTKSKFLKELKKYNYEV